jgi:hypothetical protein
VSRPRSAVLLLVLHVSGCTGWHTRDVAPEVLVSESQPYKIRVRRTDGSRLVLIDPAIQGDSIIERPHRFNPVPDSTAPNVPSTTLMEFRAGLPLVDVREIQTRGFSVGKTALLVSGVGLVALVLLAETVGVQGATPTY